MKVNLNYGVIIRNIRKLEGLNVHQFSKEIGRSSGWLSDVENCNGRCTVNEEEFNRIVEYFGAKKHRPMFRTWVANSKKFKDVDRSMEGAVLKHVRLKKGLKLYELAEKLGMSACHLSKIENGRFPPTVELRKEVLTACGYSPSSFKNLYKDEQRSKAVPALFKLEIMLSKFNAEQVNEVYEFALSLTQGGEI